MGAREPRGTPTLGHRVVHNIGRREGGRPNDPHLEWRGRVHIHLAAKVVTVPVGPAQNDCHVLLRYRRLTLARQLMAILRVTAAVKHLAHDAERLVRFR